MLEEHPTDELIVTDSDYIGPRPAPDRRARAPLGREGADRAEDDRAARPARGVRAGPGRPAVRAPAAGLRGHRLGGEADVRPRRRRPHRPASACRSGWRSRPAIKATSRGPVFYRDERIGLGEQQFGMFKFRTMVAGAADQQEELERENEAEGALFKIRDDPRVTSVGRLLRRFSLDEAPNVLNVLRGEMSLVGPRPLPLRDHALLEDWHRRRARRAAGDDRPLADLGPLRPVVRRPRAARLLLPRELVDRARHLDPREDAARRAREPRRVLSEHRFDRSSAAAFGSVAESYERARPSVPGRARRLARRAARRSGRGRRWSTSARAPASSRDSSSRAARRVIAVEPLPEMREQLEAAVPGVEVLAGSAEELPLPDGSADAVTPHRRSTGSTPTGRSPEIHRVLEPGGALGDRRQRPRPRRSAPGGRSRRSSGRTSPTSDEILSWIPVVEASPLFGPAERRSRASFEQLFDADGLAERIGTISYVARLPDGRARRCPRTDPGARRGAGRNRASRSRTESTRQRLHRVCKQFRWRRAASPYWIRCEVTEDPGGRVRRRPRLPLRLHAGVVAALEGPARGRVRPDRHSVPRPARGEPVVAYGAEPLLPRGRALRPGAGRGRAPEGRPLPAARREAIPATPTGSSGRRSGGG